MKSVRFSVGTSQDKITEEFTLEQLNIPSNLSEIEEQSKIEQAFRQWIDNEVNANWQYVIKH